MCNKIDDSVQVTEPLRIKNSNYYFGEINTVLTDKVMEYQSHIRGLSKQLPVADVVILGIGNEDVGQSRQSPLQFATSFHTLLTYLLEHVYTHGETIILKTTQFYGSFGPDRGWNHGRGEAYANVIRYSILNLSPQDQKRVHVWDTHQIGLTENSVCQEKYMSSAYVLEIENAILSHIINNNIV